MKRKHILICLLLCLAATLWLPGASHAAESTAGTEAELRNAITNATAGTTITITADITLTGTVDLSNKTITLLSDGECTIKRGSGLTTAMFLVPSGATLTLGQASGMGSSTLTIDGGAVWGGTDNATLGRGTTNSGVQSDLPILMAGDLSKQGGSIYLYSGVTLQNNYYQLNGNYGGAIYAGPKSELYIHGAVIRNNYSGQSGGAIKAINGSKIVMTAGQIYGNHAARHGGGLQIFGKQGEALHPSVNVTFTMSGSTIRNNLCGTDGFTARAGGGIAVSDNSEFRMTGGAIKDNLNNAFSGKGGGVAFADANTTVTLSGDAKITGNKVKTAVNNLHLGTNACNVVEASGLTPDASIGVTSASTANYATVTQSNGANDLSGYFASDAATRAIYNDATNAAAQVVKVGKVYTITYRDKGDAAFSGTHDAGYPSTHTYGATTTLKGATKADHTFDGWFALSNCTGTALNRLGATGYTANITLYAKWTEKAPVTVDTNPVSFPYDGSEHAFTVTPTPSGLAGFTVQYKLDSQEDADFTETVPRVVGEYDVRVTRAEDATYKSFSQVIDKGLTITRAAISSVTVTGVVTPAAGAAPDTDAACATTGIGSTGSVSWSPDDAAFLYNKAYTASVTLTTDANHAFVASPTAKLGGNTATVKRTDDTHITLSYTFPATEKLTAPTATLNQESPLAIAHTGGDTALTLNVAGLASGYADVAWTVTETDASGILTLPTPATGTLGNRTDFPLGDFTVAANAAGQPAKSASVTIAFTGGADYAALPSAITVTFNLAAGADIPAPSGISVDYTDETVAGVTGTMEYVIDGNDAANQSRINWAGAKSGGGTVLDIAGKIPAAGATAQYIHVRVTASNGGRPGLITTVLIPARPAAPTGIGKTNETVSGKNDGTITRVSDSMAYKPAGGAWTDVPTDATTLSGLAPGSYTLRYTATDSDFASAETPVLTIGTGGTLTVTFDMQGHGTAISSLTGLTYNVAVAAPEAPTATGYTFGGWYKEDVCTNAWKFTGSGADKVTDSVTLFAKWTPIAYTVSYDLEGGTHGASHPGNASFDTPFALSAPTRTGFAFTGWTVTSGLNSATAKWGVSDPPDTAIASAAAKCVNGMESIYLKNLTATAGGSVTVSANWSISNSTLKILPNGGVWERFTTTRVFVQNYNTTRAVPVPTRTGYTFTGWTRTNAYGTMTSLTDDATYTFGATGGVTDTLSANWAALHYNVTHTLANITATEGTAGENKATHGEAYTTTLRAAVGYSLPDVITVQVAGSTLRAGTDYSYTPTSGAVRIPGEGVTGSIGISAQTAPSIATQPQNVETTAGLPAVFSLAAGTGLSYQWQLSTDDGASWAAIGGATAYAYTTAATTAEQNGDQYRCVITDAHGLCATSNAATLRVHPAPAVYITPSSPRIASGGSATLTANGSGGTGTLRYAWNTVPAQSGRSITVSPAESTAYTVTVTDEKNVSATQSVTVQVAAQSYTITATPAAMDFGAATAGYTQPAARSVTIQNAGTAALALTLPASGDAFIVDTTGTASTLAPNASTSFTLRPKASLPVGSYYTAFTVQTDKNTQATVTAAFAVNPPPQVAINAEASIITGESVTLSAVVSGGTSPFAYQWSGGSTAMAQSITESPTADTAYTLTVTDADGNAAMAATTVNVIPADHTVTASDGYIEFGTITAGADVPAPQQAVIRNDGNQEVTVTAPAAAHYVITPASVSHLAPGETATFSIQPKSGLTAGAYDETLPFSTGSGTALIAAAFTINPAPTVRISGALTVLADTDMSIATDTTLTAHASGGDGAYTYAWSNGRTGAVYTSAKYSVAGTIPVTVTVTDGQGVSGSASVTITAVRQAYALSVSPGALSFDERTAGYADTDTPAAQTLTISNTGGETITGAALSGGASYTIDGDFAASDGVIAGGGSATFSVRPKTGLTAGVYDETITVSTDRGAYTAIPVTFTVNPPPAASIRGKTGITSGAQTALTATGSGGTGALDYSWTRTAAPDSAPPFSAPSGGTLDFALHTPGDYAYTFTATDQFGARATASATITVAPSTCAIAVSPGANAFPGRTAGYTAAPAAKTFTVTNKGNRQITLTPPVSGASFAIDTTGTALTLAPYESTTFTVRPRTGLYAGIYSESFTVTADDGAGGSCSAALTAGFSVQTAPAVSIEGDLVIVAGQNATLRATAFGGTGPYAYRWSSGSAETAAITVSPAATTTYSVTATDASGVAATQSVTVSVTPRDDTIDVTPDGGVAFDRRSFGAAQPPARTISVENKGNGDVTLKAPASNAANSAFILGPLSDATPGAGQTATFTVQPKASLGVGTYTETITVETANGTGSDAINVTFTVAAAPTVRITPAASTIIRGDSVTLTASASGGTGGYQYLWNTAQTTAAITVSPTANTVYHVTLTDNSGVVAQAEATVTVQEPGYTIRLSPADRRWAATVGYSAPSAQTVTVANTGNRPITGYTATLSTGDPAAFAITYISTAIPVNGRAAFTVQPATGLGAGTYTGTVLVTTAEGSSAAMTVELVVSDPAPSNPDPAPDPAPVDPVPIPIPVPDPIPETPPAPAAPQKPAVPMEDPGAVKPAAPTEPSEALPEALEELPAPALDIPIGEGGIGKPPDMAEADYQQALDSVLASIDALMEGHIDAPLDISTLDKAAIQSAESLYQSAWAQKEPDMLRLLDLETGTRTASKSYEDGKTPILVAELIETREIVAEALRQSGTEKTIAVYDIRLLYNGVEIQPNGMLTITLSFKAHRGEALTIAHKRSDGVWEFFDVTVNADGFASISVDSLSPFAILAAADPKPVAAAPIATAPAAPQSPAVEIIAAEPAPASASGGWGWIAAGAICAALVTCLLVRRGRKRP
ncbi:MAG: InlB B-repeat-containing protein [Clostridia bacterium]|nr:InlB B-repeat-containing protein [Clostridia bacterium]